MSSSSEHWMYPSPLPLPLADSWISEAFARDTHVLTQALHKSLSHTLPPNNPSSYFNIETPSSFSAGAASASASGSDLETPAAAPKRRAAPVSAGKITKRKSRASKRNTTTFITADPANFRQMVQQVTGVKFGNGVGPVVSVPLLKPQPQRASSFNSSFQGCLPTLDTSAFLLHHHNSHQSPTIDQSPAPVADGGGASAFQLGSFPTLESWN